MRHEVRDMSVGEGLEFCELLWRHATAQQLGRVLLVRWHLVSPNGLAVPGYSCPAASSNDVALPGTSKLMYRAFVPESWQERIVGQVEIGLHEYTRPSSSTDHKYRMCEDGVNDTIDS